MLIRRVLVLIIFLFAWSTTARAGEGVPGLFHRSSPPEALYVIEREDLSNADWHLAVIIQGMVSRERPRIYIVWDLEGSRGDNLFLSYYEKEYRIENLGVITVEEALEMFSDLFRGYALFSLDEGWTMNAADTFCSINDCLPVTADQEALAIQAGLEKIEDFRGRWKSREESIRWSRKELLPHCSKKAAASIEQHRQNSRDYTFAHRIYTFHLLASGKQYFELRKTLSELPENIPMIGYIARNGVEEWIVEYALADYGKYMIPTNTVPNLTVHSGIPVEPLPEFDQWTEPPEIRGKLGVAFAFTDGDNLHLEAEYYPKKNYWEHPRRGEIKVTWSMAPQLYELAPAMLRYYYQTRTENDFFITLSGAGYTFPSSYSDQAFFRSASLQYMKLSHMDVLWNLDPKLYLVLDKWSVARVLDPMGTDYIRGHLHGYAPPLHRRDWIIPPGHPPLMFSRPFYFLTTKQRLIKLIKYDAALTPKRGRVVFYGLNNWEIDYGDLLEITERFSHRKDIILLSPQEAITIIKRWND
jgi:hypothetical protein